MLATPYHSRAVEYLRRVAESRDSTAYHAIELLIADSYGGSWTGIPPTAAEREQTVSVLKALASSGRVTDIRGAQFLEIWVGRNRSERPSYGRP